MSAMALRARRRSSRGFTLVEMSIVVVCVGILAALALVGFVRYRRQARMAEATNLVTTIKTEQEAHRAESGLYVSVSNSITSYYPAANPGSFATPWGAPCGNCLDPAAWDHLGVRPTAPVVYGYATVSGVGADVNPTATPTSTMRFSRRLVASDPDISGAGGDTTGLDSADACQKIEPTDPYYLIQAHGDVDGDGVACTVLALSCSNTLILTNAGE